MGIKGLVHAIQKRLDMPINPFPHADQPHSPCRSTPSVMLRNPFLQACHPLALGRVRGGFRERRGVIEGR